MATLSFDSVSLMYGGTFLVERKNRPRTYTVEFKRKLALEAKGMTEAQMQELSIKNKLPINAIRDFKRDYNGGRL